jgi:hypothetical protein
MVTKFTYIDHKIKITNQELENVKKTQLNIKITQFIEKTKIKVCLTTFDEIKKLSSKIPCFADVTNSSDNPHKFLLSKKNKKEYCIHKTKIEQKIYTKGKIFFKKMHPKNINQFCQHLAEYYKYAYEDIMINSKAKHNRPKYEMTKQLKKRQVLTTSNYKWSSTKEIIEQYMKYLSDEIKQSIIFNDNLINMNEAKKEKEKTLQVIKNYIFKTLCIKICDNEKELNSLYIDDNDKNFIVACNKISWINPEHLEIQKEVFDEKLFKKVEYNIKRMDFLRTPGGILNQFGLTVQLINSMYIFLLNQNKAEAGDFLPLIIYGIIISKPKRMIFNNRFTKYFMNENDTLGNIGYNSTQAESSIKFIQNINGKTFKMEKQEFEEKCKKQLEIESNLQTNEDIKEQSDNYSYI